MKCHNYNNEEKKWNYSNDNHEHSIAYILGRPKVEYQNIEYKLGRMIKNNKVSISVIKGEEQVIQWCKIGGRNT